MNSNYRTNFQPIQVSDMLFRYSFTSHKGGGIDGQARDFGWGVQNPLIPVFMKGKQEGSLPQSTSFCSIDASNVILVNMKIAEDSDGIIFRLMETEGKETTATITLPFVDISEAYLTNLVEENETLLSSQRHTITVPLKAFSISALRVKYCSP